MSLGKEVYLKELIKAADLILCAQDRDPSSPTYGSFDREYWAWATKDFANIDLQRAIYPLAMLYKTKDALNPYYKKEKLLEWIKAGFDFWCKSQLKDGSFDHLYPHEHSVVGASFTLYEIAEAYLILEGDLDSSFKKSLMKKMVKSADFLAVTTEYHGFISNHRAGTCASLYVMYNITKNKNYVKKAEELIDTIEERQSKNDGWFSEYDGADPGYQTLGTYYMANCYRLTKSKRLLEMLRNSIKFIQYFVHPDGTIGGEYGSRNTEIYMPGGFEIMASDIPEAESIAEFLLNSIEEGKLPHLTSMDIRNFVPFMGTYTCAFLNYSRKGNSPVLPCKRKESFEKYFSDYEIFVKKTEKYYAVLGISKGGVLKVYDLKEKKLLDSSCGYLGTQKNGKMISNQMLDYGTKVRIKDSIVSFEKSFFYVPLRIMTPMRFALFRIFNYTVGRISFINDIVRKYFIIGKFVRPHDKAKLKIKRVFSFLENDILIDDIILNPKKIIIKNLTPLERFTTIFMATSKYFQPNHLEFSKEFEPKEVKGRFDTAKFHKRVSL